LFAWVAFSLAVGGLFLTMGKALIHLVDDDPTVRGTLARLLVSGGYQVKEYESGLDLLEAANSLNGGYVLLDINMPGADGFAVKKALSDRAIDVPVIMMTGSGDLTILAFRAGVADFMQKPFGRGELLAVLDQISKDRQPARSNKLQEAAF
jgi:two-component system, LuxR family, response regulator FixJ